MIEHLTNQNLYMSKAKDARNLIIEDWTGKRKLIDIVYYKKYYLLYKCINKM